MRSGRVFGFTLLFATLLASAASDARAVTIVSEARFVSALVCDTCTTRLCPSEDIQVRLAGRMRDCDRVASWAVQPAGSGVGPAVRVVTTPGGGGCEWDAPWAIGVELPGLPPGDYALVVTCVDSIPLDGGAPPLLTTSTASFAFRVEAVCPPPAPRYASSIQVGPPALEGEPVPVAASGAVRDACRHFERLELVGPGTPVPGLRLVVGDEGCRPGPYVMPEEPTFAAQVALPPLAEGDWTLAVETVVRSDCDTTRVLERRVDMVPFTVLTASVDRLAPVVSLALSAPAPNPFREQTAFTLQLPAPADVQLGIYDLAGRRIATLHRGALPAGVHAFRWNGRDDAGRAVRPGAYVVAVRAGDGPMLGRMVVRTGH